MEITVHRKSFAGSVELHGASASVDGEGAFRATIARISVDGQPAIDKEGDAYIGPQAFPRGKSIVISAYGHKSWEGALPVGYGVIGANQHSAWVSGQFFTNTTPGRDTYLTVKQLAAEGLGDWSYGYEVVDASFDKVPPGAKRLIKAMDIFEASPVLVGAGVGTGIDVIKRAEIAELDAQLAAMRAYKRFLEQVRDMRASGALDVDRSDEIARSAMRALRGAHETLRRTA